MVLLCAFLFVSCNTENTVRETPTSGTITIASDESFEPIIGTTIATFTTLYPYANITPVYKYEPDVINDFLRDSVKVIVSSKQLTAEQTQFLNDSLIFPETTSYVRDAIAFIVNKDNPDTLLMYEELYGIFKGSFTQWMDVNPVSPLGGIRVIFDNTRSGNIRFLKEQFGIEGTFPSNFFAMDSIHEVIDFVSQNVDAIGVISVGFISDKDNRKHREYLDMVNLVAVSSPNSDGKTYYRPSQGSIYEKTYPFCREVYFISRETFTGLGSGFIQFATGEQGQRIVLKSGLIPSRMPERNVRVVN